MSVLPGASDQSAELVVVVAPDGDDDAPGTAARPVASLEEARRRLRAGGRGGTALLADGVWHLEQPLRLSASDSGVPGAPRRWTAAPGARPVLSGGVVVTGWELLDAARDLYRAHLPQVADTRQVSVDGALADRPWMTLDRATVTVTDEGLELGDPALGWLQRLQAPHRAEVVCTASFTHRYAPVERVEPGRLIMQQPAWRNNNWGWDTLVDPIEGGALRLVNVPELIAAGQWWFDPEDRTLLLRTAPGDHPAAHHVVVPRLASLIEVAGTLDTPVHDLELSGLTFAHTTWLGPSTPVGYAGQQAGTFLGREFPQPRDYLRTAQRSCPEFEATRSAWEQVPAAVQVSAAAHVRVADCTFTELGQVGLGIGNDAGAHAAGVGLAVGGVAVQHNLFTQLAGAAVVVGGVGPQAHHPDDPRSVVRDVRLDNNLVTRVSLDYMDMPGILCTYVDGAEILHNEVCHLPYDGIDVGFGWGANDAGGSPEYRRRGLYASQPVYDTPTTLRRTVVVRNLVHHTKEVFSDGGAIYTLSANPGALVAENHVRDNGRSVGLYLDEGSRYVTVRHNVVEGAPVWVFTNTYNEVTTGDDVITDNWYDGGRTHTPEPEEHRIELARNRLVTDGAWPPEAVRVRARAGVEPHLRAFAGVPGHARVTASSAPGPSSGGRSGGHAPA